MAVVAYAGRGGKRKPGMNPAKINLQESRKN
jgi:hypothetical protein